MVLSSSKVANVTFTAQSQTSLKDMLNYRFAVLFYSSEEMSKSCRVRHDDLQPHFFYKTTTFLFVNKHALLIPSLPFLSFCWNASPPTPQCWHTNLPQKSLGCHKCGKNGSLVSCMPGTTRDVLQKLVQLAVKVACPLFGPGVWSGLPPQHRGVLWERVKSMRSVQRRRLRVPESEPQG